MLNNQDGIIRSNEPILAVIQRWLDVLVISLALLLVMLWRDTPYTPQHWVNLLVALFTFYLLNDVSQLYGSWRGEHSFREHRRVAGNWGAAFVSMFVADYFLFHNTWLSDPDKLYWFATGLLILSGYRIALRQIMRTLRANGYNTRTVAIVGAGPLGKRLANNIISNPWMGLDLLGFYDDQISDAVYLDRKQGFMRIRGDLQAVVGAARAGYIDKVYITLPMGAEDRIKWLLDQLSDSTASVYLIPNVFIFDLLHARSESINGLPSISIFDSPMDGASRLVKRIEDIALSAIILTIIALPMLLIALGVRMTSSGPALFRQKRYGMDGRPIEIWKFRSMTVMENGGIVTQAKRNDVRITPFGAFLRRTSLDELPQFINVLRGEMSIVGPRPHAIAHNEEYRKLIAGYMLRHKVKPGITGWAQINGWRGETDTLDKMQKRIEYDLNYIRRWTLWLDLKIVFLTIFKGFMNKNAY
ncbi:putative colanic acid biosysnthesis UDP-glucose lipid carrier transferase [Halopseudomonas litoralis]|uniref:Putative colanic acid biosysnthesis UDP-glucose lipid carrier transferase n=1 Tax=Halopseudomonas litoralis TaxID=797277 RepID=A0A1H1P509_9GAMM|nr:undecaprenyl-phosphate glucose phosphotransferase [Halopseudomonas litoralis]SDS06331.1 putative colanic acid biosysnthesis UDP-glucose lipid carrier transferase [Halopseudomonas litoralis]